MRESNLTRCRRETYMMAILYQCCAPLPEPPLHAISLERTLTQPGDTSHVPVAVNYVRLL